MLQQTQVATVIPYYERFIAAFPDLGALAAAPIDRVLADWSGLGYYRRAHHLHAAATAIAAKRGGRFPRTLDAVAALPGVGRSTAAAIVVFAFDQRAAILDGNVKRVLARHRGIDGFPGAPKVEAELWRTAEDLLPSRDVDTYTQALMDLGATVCTEPGRAAANVRSRSTALRCATGASTNRRHRARRRHCRNASCACLSSSAPARSCGKAACDRHLGRAVEPARSRCHRRGDQTLPCSVRCAGRRRR
jgi:A/G-specific adenine glycosylase